MSGGTLRHAPRYFCFIPPCCILERLFSCHCLVPPTSVPFLPQSSRHVAHGSSNSPSESGHFSPHGLSSPIVHPSPDKITLTGNPPTSGSVGPHPDAHSRKPYRSLPLEIEGLRMIPTRIAPRTASMVFPFSTSDVDFGVIASSSGPCR